MATVPALSELVRVLDLSGIAVFALTGGELAHTTGLHVPVDAGVAAAFLR